ncbi:MAG: Ig-like domain-containing protein [Gemmatimonadota bacterium]|nr:Ig-like domain-containing protein [Gemmatimonadota bacterium]
MTISLLLHRRRAAGLLRACLLAATVVAGVTCKDSTGPRSASTASVQIVPDSSLLAVGDSVRLTALVRDASGATLGGRTIVWSSRDAGVAPVTSVGMVHGMRAGRTAVIATVEGHADTVAIVVKAPISRTTVTPAADTLTALGATAQLAAASFAGTDALPGSYVWTSSDESIATVSANGLVTARGNGIVRIVVREIGGTADSASIVVAQQVARVVLTPATATRAVGRSLQYGAVAYDANGNVVPGISFLWASRTPALATVSASGLASAVAEGRDTLEAIGGGISGRAELVVAPQPTLRFSFSTTEVGAGQDAAVPGGFTPAITLDAPADLAASVTLSSSDASIARPNASTSLSVGQSSAPITIQGLRTGTVMLTASAPGYQSATAIVRVSTPRLLALPATNGVETLSGTQSRGFSVAVADSSGTRHTPLSAVTVALSVTDATVISTDASSVTIAAGTASSSVVSANAVGGGSAQVLLTATGLSADSLRFTVVATAMTLAPRRAVIGLRQSSGGGAGTITFAAARSTATTVTLSHNHPERVTIPSSVVVAAGATTATFGWSGIALGGDTIVARAASFNPDTMVATVSSPALVADNPPANVFYAAPATTLYARAADTLLTAHFPLDTVTVLVTSSDPSVVSPDSARIHIVKGAAASTPLRVSYVGIGSATITFTDSAGVYAPFTTARVVVSPASLRFVSSRASATSPLTLGMRQTLGADRIRVQLASATSAPLVVTLSSADPTVAQLPATVTIPAGGTSALVDVTGQDRIASTLLSLSASGYTPDTLTIDVGRPRFSVATATSAFTTSPSAPITVTVTDQTGRVRVAAEDVPITLATGDPSVATPDSSNITVKAGTSSHSTARLRFIGAGTTTLTASDSRAVAWSYDPGSSAPIVVSLPPLAFSFTTHTMGVGQSYGASVGIPSGTVNPGLTVTLTHRNGAVSSTPATLSIPAGQGSAAFTVSGTAVGIDTIIASAPGYLPDTAVVDVEPDRVLLVGLPGSLSIDSTVLVHLENVDPNGVIRAVATATTFDVYTTPQLAVNGVAGTSTPITIPAGSTLSPSFRITAKSAGSALVRVSNPGYAQLQRAVTVSP